MRSTSVRAGAVLAVLLTVLAASGAPLSAATASLQSDQLVVGSTHQDFGTDDEVAPTLADGTEVTGSGDSASVTYSPIVDTIEDGDLSEYGGDTDQASVVSTPARDEYAAELTTTGLRHQIVSTAGLEQYPDPGETFSTRVYLSDTSAYTSAQVIFAAQSSTADDPDGYRVALEESSNDFVLIKGNISSDFNELDRTNAPIKDHALEWLEVTVEWGADGQITAHLTAPDGTVLASVSAYDTQFTSGGVGYWFNNRNGQSDSAYFDDVLVENTDDTHYQSAVHQVSNAEIARVDVNLQNATATAIVQSRANASDSWSAVNRTSVSSSGVHPIDLHQPADTQFRVLVDFNTTSKNTVAELADEAILFTNHQPQADNFTPAGSTAEDQSVEFSADVSDPEFSTAQGDEVTAELFVDGTSEHTASVTQNGTVATTVDLTEGGTHDYYWTLTDSYGASTTTATQQVQVPSNLYIRNVSNPTGILNGSEFSSTVTLYPNEEGESVEITRDVSDGEISLTGLSVDSRIVAQVQEDNYYTRRTLITSIYDQQSVYLLNNNETASQITFELADETGQYDASSSYLILRRALDLGGNTTDWQAIAGDAFDATGSFQTMLQPDVRYQLVIMNDDGDRRVIGYYDPPDRDTREQLPIGSVSIEGQLDEQGWTAGAEMTTVNETAVVGVRYYDPTTETSDLTVRVYNVTDNSESLVYETSYTGPIGTHTESIDLPNQDPGGTYRVDFTGVQDGESFNGSVDVGAATPPTGFIEAIPDAAGFAIGLAAIALSGIIVVTASSGAAVIVAAIVAELVSLLGLVPLHPVQVGVAMAIGLVYHFAGK